MSGQIVLFNLTLLVIIAASLGAMICQDLSNGIGGSLTRDNGPWQRQVSLELQELKRSFEMLTYRPPSDSRKLEDQPMFDIRYDSLPERCQPHSRPTNCGEATACTHLSGYYYIYIKDYSNDSVLVECDAHTEGGDWLVLQRRHDGSEDFYRSWAEYRNGFGSLNGEFFWGMEKLYYLTNFNGPQELMIVMENATNSARTKVKYDSFAIGSESENYKLKSLGRFVGDVKDSLRYALGLGFTTKDKDNDKYAENCSHLYMGGWWYAACHSSNLNGHYGDVSYGKGLNWVGFTDHKSTCSYVKMMIRRRRTTMKLKK